VKYQMWRIERSDAAPGPVGGAIAGARRG
jgi:hypothetical protein